MISIPTTYLVLLVTVTVFMTALYGISRYLGKRDDLADVAWGTIFIMIAGVCLGIKQESFNMQPSYIVAALVTIWGVRLAAHIGSRFLKSKEEDHRYVEMRARASLPPALYSYVRVFLSQGMLALLISAPIIVTIIGDPELTVLTWIGTAVWIGGFIFESVGDAQLKRFVKKPSNKGTLMITGLWKYSRHPNYFGELTQWWGLGIIALAAPYGWIALAGPLLLTVLITKISGVPLAEKRSNTKPGWQSYKAKTSVLIPLPPR